MRSPSQRIMGSGHGSAPASGQGVVGRARPASPLLAVALAAAALATGLFPVIPAMAQAATSVPVESYAPTRPWAGHVTLMTHDSFYLPEEVLESFRVNHGAEVRILRAGDAGLMVNQAILVAGDPLADVMYGIDDTFLSRALEADVFEPYVSPLLGQVDARLLADPLNRVTPIDVGHVCLNLDVAALEVAGLPVPQRLEDLLLPELRGTLVVQNPATSSPGLAFLIATVERFGEGGWQEYWRGLRANDVAVTPGWEDAYYGRFSGGSGEGDRPIVVSYATSPVAEVVFGPDPDAEQAPTAALEDGCIRQIEFAGILRGAARPELGAALIDHLLSVDVQSAVPLSMFVYPARRDIPLPPAFERHGLVPADPIVVDPARVAAERERWIEEWTDIVLR